jgi:hypothetical protein
MSVIQVGLVDKTGKLDPRLVSDVAAALNIQVMRDLPQYWKVRATVRHLPDPKRIPVGVWPVFIVARLPPGEGGVHLDRSNQPYSKVIGTPHDESWTIDASHETLEMLVDPHGNRVQTSRGIAVRGANVTDVHGDVDYLVEACDPCEGNKYAYSIHGVAVSDFITPHFYDPVVTEGTRYSFGGNIKRPRQILPGGYITFIDHKKKQVEQILFLGSRPEQHSLGPARGASLRAFVDAETRAAVHASRTPNDELARWNRAHREAIDEAALDRGASFLDDV